jgi:hypothetical protein
VGIPLPTVPGSSSLPRLARSRRWLATLTLLASLAAGCGGGQAVASRTAAPPKTSSTAHATGTTPSSNASATPTSYCDAQDTTIPGAAAFLTGGPQPSNLTAVQQAWLQMQSSMVPACSEIVPDATVVQTKNLTNGELSDAAFKTWVTEDQEWWTLAEWAGQHDQPDFVTYLLGGTGDTFTSFLRAGGKVVDSRPCEYASKYDAVSVTAEQMSDLTVNRLTSAGVVFVGAAVGPCTSTWTASDGTVTNKGLAAEQEGRELDVTTTQTNAALGQFLVVNDSWDQGDDTTADSIVAQVGI